MAFSFCFSFSFWWRWWLVHTQCLPSHPPLLLHQWCKCHAAMVWPWELSGPLRPCEGASGTLEGLRDILWELLSQESHVPPPDCGLVDLGLPRDATMLCMHYSFPNLFLIFKNELPPQGEPGGISVFPALFSALEPGLGAPSQLLSPPQSRKPPATVYDLGSLQLSRLLGYRCHWHFFFFLRFIYLYTLFFDCGVCSLLHGGFL